VARLLVISGRVHGVGYRDAAVQAAFESGVHGWVRNRRDGSVEAYVQGDSQSVGRFVAWCHRGPPLARVTEVASDEVELDVELRTFATRATV
jgi:acylphosphatase